MIKLDYSVASKKVNNKIKKTWEEQTWLNYNNLRPQDKTVLRTKYNGFLSKNGNIAFSTLKPTERNDPKTFKIINSYKYLESTGAYEMPSLDIMMSDLAAAKNDILTADDKTNIKKSTDEMWLKFMEKIHEPETQLLLKSFGQYSLAKSSFGWKLSALNIIRVRAQKPDATFIQTRKQWHDKYGRRVLPNSQKIGVMVPLNDSPYINKNDLANTMKQIGYNDNVSFDDLSIQQKDHVKISSVQGQGKGFILTTYYDVSDTALIDPNQPDKWAEEVGFENNLTGKLNAAAIRQRAEKGGDTEENIAKLYNNEEGDIKALTIALSEGIKTEYPDVQTSLPKMDNVNAYKKCYADMLERLSDRLIEDKAKIVKKENRQEGVLIASTIVMCFTKVSPEIVANRLATNTFTSDSYFELRTIINDILTLIKTNMPRQESKHNINEFEIPLLKSVDELLSMMGMSMEDVKKTEHQGEEPNMEECSDVNAIKENFYRMFDRINKTFI